MLAGALDPDGRQFTLDGLDRRFESFHRDRLSRKAARQLRPDTDHTRPVRLFRGE